MSGTLTAYCGAQVFDGTRLRSGLALLVAPPLLAGIVPEGELPAEAERIELKGGILAPGYVDLQVNGGGGVMFNDAPTPATLSQIAKAHARIGATTILPTLITDTPETTRAAIDAVTGAVRDGLPGIAGLHLEGPHLSLTRKGAHDPALIRPAGEADLALMLDAAEHLPRLMVTLAPESVTPDQISRLAAAGVIVSLGHSDASYARSVEAAEAGASCVTHLFNAMSQLGNREPGLVGAALGLGALSAGLIADMIHVHPASIAAALRAKAGPGQLFLVSDAMATAGSDIRYFTLNGRTISRTDDRLTLSDGTLAGAHLDLTTALRNMMKHVGLKPEEALAMATSIPAAVIGRAGEIGALRKGTRADLIHLSDDLSLTGVWQGGEKLV